MPVKLEEIDEATMTDLDLQKVCLNIQSGKGDTKRLTEHSWKYPKEPWCRVHIEYAGPFMNQYFLIVADAYTKWLEIIPTTSIAATAIINILKKLYTTFGLPIAQVTDNSRHFRSEEMQRFLKENGIQAIYTAPFYISSNGQAKRYVQSLKNELRAMTVEKGSLQDKLQKYLMSYRKTRKTPTRLSPAEMMFKRLYRTRIDFEKVNNNNKVLTIDKQFKRRDKVQIRLYAGNKWKKVSIEGRTHRRVVDPIPNQKIVKISIQSSPYKLNSTPKAPSPKNRQTILPENVPKSMEHRQKAQAIKSTLPVATQNIHNEIVMRSSTRNRRAPTRLNL